MRWASDEGLVSPVREDPPLLTLDAIGVRGKGQMGVVME